MKRFVVALVLLAVACSREPRPATPSAAAAQPDPEARNLLTLHAGAVALARTGELTYDASIVHALDGTSSTYWSSPLDGPNQTLTFALPSRSRIERLGIITAVESFNIPNAVDFESSLDGVQWTPLKILRVKSGYDLQSIAVNTEARYIRLHATAPAGQTYTVIRSVAAEGRALEPPRTGSLDGCWMLDGLPARFEQRGTRITGVILAPDGAIYLDGGLDRQTFLAMWLQAPMWGHAAITVTADGQHLSMLQWHEEVQWDYAGQGLLGQRAACTDIPLPGPQLIDDLLRRAGRWAVYAHDSPAAIDALVQTLARHPTRRFRIVAREFHKGSPERRLASLREALRARGADLARIDFVDAGADPAGRAVATELEKRFVGTVELELSKGR